MSQQYSNFRIGTEAAITLVLMAFVPVFIKFTSANTFTIGVFRLLVATLLLAIFLRPKSLSGISRKKVLLPLIVIGFFFALHWITYFFSIKTATASIGLLGMSTYGIHLIFLGWAIRKQRPSIFDFMALAIALIGTYFVIPEFSMSNNITVGIVLGIVSGFCFALLPVLHQQYVIIPERTRIFGQFFFALIGFSFLLPMTEWSFSAVDWWALVYLAVGGTFVAHTLWVRVTTTISTTISSVIFYLIVPMTMVISHFWLKEPMPFTKIIGAFLIVLGNIVSMLGKIWFRRRAV